MRSGMPWRYVPVGLLVWIAGIPAVLADCASCGCDTESCRRKICKLVRTEREIAVTCYKCECEDFCIPDPSSPVCRHCQQACEPDCGCDAGKHAKWFRWIQWKPSSAKIATRKKLYSKVAKKKLPDYQWIVVDACQCGSHRPPRPGLGVDTGWAKSAPLGAHVGQVIPARQSELLKIAERRTIQPPEPRRRHDKTIGR